jgi:hypothetical protein
MYQGDFLEIVWMLKREKIRSSKLDKALELLKSKRGPDSSWKIERTIKDLVIPIGKKTGSEFITQRAKEVLDFYHA